MRISDALHRAAGQAVNRANTILDKAAGHPITVRLETQYLALCRRLGQIRAAGDRQAGRMRLLLRGAVRRVDAVLDSAAHSRWFDRLEQYALLVRLHRPIGILLLMWPTLIALWIAAGGVPDIGVLLVFITGVVLMRSAGCAINDFADRHIDGHVRRTDQRPMVSGKVSEKEALGVFAALSITAFILVLFMNRLTIYMSFAGVLLAATYPFMKRFHYLPQVHLGAAFGWAIPMAYTAQANEITPMTWLLFFATVLWTVVYDTMYAMADREDDLKIGVKSTAILFGSADRLIIGVIQLMLIFNLLIIGHRAEMSGFYYTGVVIAAVFGAWQQYLIRHREPAKCFEAFLNNNWFGLALFTGVVADYSLGTLT